MNGKRKLNEALEKLNFGKILNTLKDIELFVTNKLTSYISISEEYSHPSRVR